MTKRNGSVLPHVEHLFEVEQDLRESAVAYQAKDCRATRADLRAAAVAYANAANIAEDAIADVLEEAPRG